MTREEANIHWRCQADENEPHPPSLTPSTCELAPLWLRVQVCKTEIWCTSTPT